MDSNSQEAVEQQLPTPRLQIYSTSVTGVSPFWREKYEKDAKKYWDVFYKRHEDRFFKDRHYLDKEWGHYFSGTKRKVVLEVGCGVGNTVFPLVDSYPDVFVHACDFSPRAVNLVKAHKDFKESHIRAFVCDLTVDDLSKQISPSSIDVVTMIFVLSAVSPEKMPLVLQNIKKVLKPNGYVLFRDYATGDLAQERLICKDQKISENFYVRGDGTRAFYFSNEFLTTLFKENGFYIEDLGICCKQVENRSRQLVMNRRWVQAVFCLSDSVKFSSGMETEIIADYCNQDDIEPKIKENNNSNGFVDDFEICMSEGVAADMFVLSPSGDNEILEVDVEGRIFKIKALSKEYQHTCKSTGLMIWESASLMASVLARNPNIISQKRVLELGCGCAGICSMIAVGSADLVIATDGDAKALDILSCNIASNLEPRLVSKLISRRLEWGNKDDIKAIKEVSSTGFDIIMGTDVIYVSEAILPLFETAKELIASKEGCGENKEPVFILCHVLRRVDEPTILKCASAFGFKLVDKWAAGIASQGIISSWFSEKDSKCIAGTDLNIMYFGL